MLRFLFHLRCFNAIIFASIYRALKKNDAKMMKSFLLNDNVKMSCQLGREVRQNVSMVSAKEGGSKKRQKKVSADK